MSTLGNKTRNDTQWHVPEPSALIWESWGSEYSLFNRISGETHLINELPAEILRRLTAHPLRTLDLAGSLAADCETESRAQWQETIETILANLNELGLIEKTFG